MKLQTMTSEHGDDYQGTLKANFSSNVWYNADNTELYRHLSAILPDTRRYPEMEAESFREVLAGMLSLNTSCISIGNGSIDIIYRIAQAFRGKKSIIVSPSFSEYSNACSVNDHNVLLCYRENLLIEIDKFQPDLVWICNPNNPDGYCCDRKELQALFYTYPQVTFILDQSFVEFTLQETPAADSVLEFKNLIIIYSLTKRYTIPGLRVGYVVASECTITKLDKFKIPWSVNTLAIEAGKYMLNRQDTSFDLSSWLAETIRFQREINRIGIFKTLPSHTPFFLVEILTGRTADLKDYLLSEGILIRDATNFENNAKEIMRLNTLSWQQNDLLIMKLRIWKQNL
jgi:threonine-phosphate decarboxylase